MSLVVLVCLMIYTGIAAMTYKPSSIAQTSYQQAQAQKGKSWLHFPTKGTSIASFVFYPGALVEPKAYAVLAEKLSRQGIETYIVISPLNLPILDRGISREVMSENHLSQVYLGGHSLGGVVASMDTLENSKQVAGLILLASYPPEKSNLSPLSLPVLSLTASQDQVLKWDKYESAKSRLPKDTTYQMIDGGNHSGFGHFGQQRGDGKATISTDQQQEAVAQAIVEFIQGQKGK